MKINAVNTSNYNIQKNNSNINFGASWLNAKHAQRFLEYAKDYCTHENAYKMFQTINRSGCKNSQTSVKINDYASEGIELFLSFPGIKKKEFLGQIGSYVSINDMEKSISEAQDKLLKKVIFESAVTGKLEKTKAYLSDILPELHEDITKYSGAEEVQTINKMVQDSLAKKAAYKKEHPILSLFHTPEF